MSSDTQFKASDSVSEVSHAQKNTPNFNVLDLMKGAQQGPNDSVSTAKNYLPSMSLTGDDFNLYKPPSVEMPRDGQAMPLGPIGQGQPIEQGQPIGKIIQGEPLAGPVEPLGQPIEIGTVSPPIPVEQPSVIGKVSPPQPILIPGPPGGDPRYFM